MAVRSPAPAAMEPGPPGLAAPPKPTPRAVSVPTGPVGVASWYAGRPATCDGHPVPAAVTVWAANRTLPCGMLVKLTGPMGSITIPIEDRGPWVAGRDWDLPPSVFRVLFGGLGSGVGRVTWQPGS